MPGNRRRPRFAPNAFYDFRIDNNGDWHEDVTLRIRFTELDAADIQTFNVERIDSASKAEPLGQGKTNEIVTLTNGGRVWAGLSADPFFADGVALGEFQQALYTQQRFTPEAFKRGFNLFGGRNVTPIVLEIPSAVLGSGTIHVWAVTAITENDRFAQVERIGRPLIQPVFNVADAQADAHNHGQPADDVANASAHIAGVVAMITGLGKTASDPAVYGAAVAARILPDALTYQIGTPAGYTFATFNGRRLTDDVMDVTLNLVANMPISDNVATDNRFQTEFPYIAPAHVQPAEMPALKALLAGQ